MNIKHSPRPSTAPSPSASSTTTTTTTILQPPPLLPPIPAILSHSPARAHLFQHLLQHAQLQPLNHLILLLDLLAVIRAHASQTNWSFDEPPPIPTHPHPQSKKPLRSKSRRIRPGTSDGSPPPPRLHTSRSHLPCPTLFNPARSLYHNDQPKPLEQSSSTPASDHQKPPEPSWVTHFVELYTPPELDLKHGWFIPLPLPQNSLTLKSLNNALPRPNQPLTINLGLTALKQVGQTGCLELSEFQTVKDWWNRHSASLWPQCTLQSKCESFNDLLGLWPSLHFPTPSLSQLYKLSAQLSKSRSRMRLVEYSSQGLYNSQAHLSRTTLLGLFQVHLGQPSSSDQATIERLFPQQAEEQQPAASVRLKPAARPSTASGHGSSPRPSPQASSPTTRPRGQSTSSSGNSSRPSTSSIFRSPTVFNPDLPQDLGLSPKTHSSKLIDFRTNKLRQFFGYEVDSILPNQDPARRDPSPTSGAKKSCFLSTLISPDVSPSWVQNNNRRKSINTEFDEQDRPRKRSSTATIDISLATLATSSQSDNERLCSTPTSPDLTAPVSSFHRPITRVTIVGTSPTNTPTFFSLDKPRLPHPNQPRKSLGLDEDSLGEPIIDGFSPLRSHHRAVNNHWGFPHVQSQDNDPRTLKRMTKLEKILGEPVNSVSGYAGLGVNVVTEVVEDIEPAGLPEGSMTSSEMGRHRSEDPPRSPIQWDHYHSRASSTQGMHLSSYLHPKPSHHPSPPRPSTTHFDRPTQPPPPQNSLGSSRMTGKWRLDKLHRFLGDVTHHTANSHPSADESGPMNHSGMTSIGHIQMGIDDRYRFPDSSHSHRPTTTSIATPTTTSTNSTTLAAMLESEPKEVKKRPSRFKISGSNIRPSFEFSSSAERISSDLTSTRPSSSASTSSNFFGPALSSSSSASSSASPFIAPVPFGQYSYRSARKLEKLLGEQIPPGSAHSSSSLSDLDWDLPPLVLHSHQPWDSHENLEDCTIHHQHHHQHPHLLQHQHRQRHQQKQKQQDLEIPSHDHPPVNHPHPSASASAATAAPPHQPSIPV